MHLPHPIPYQGSKRNLAPLIAPYVPKKGRTMFEPFAGSAAMTIYAAHHDLADRFVVGDSLKAIVDLWESIVRSPVRRLHDIGVYGRGRQRLALTTSTSSALDTTKPVILWICCT